MPNITSAKKALRQSTKKRAHNLLWRRRIRNATRSLKKSLETKNMDLDILKKEESLLQKLLDKAAKSKVVHKNKANRLKSRYAKRISALQQHTKTAGGSSSSKRSKPKSA